jgi:hypothetical protein
MICLLLTLIGFSQADQPYSAVPPGVHQNHKPVMKKPECPDAVLAVITPVILNLKGRMPVKEDYIRKVNAMFLNILPALVFIPFVQHEFIVCTSMDTVKRLLA